MDRTTARFLTTEEARSALSGLDPSDPLRAITRLRKRFSQDEASALLQQAELRERASDRLGSLADRMLFTEKGLEQATHPFVAAHHARLLKGAGSILEVGAGLGVDTLAFLEAGLRVTALEPDPATRELLRYNLRSHAARVEILGEGLEAYDGPVSAVYADPDRRPDGDRVAPVRADLRLGARPDWKRLSAVLKQADTGLVKAPPTQMLHGLEPLPTPEWISVGGRMKECLLRFGTLADDRHRATILGEEEPAVLFDDDRDDVPPALEMGDWLHDPDPSVTVSGLVGTLARRLDAAPVEHRVAYLTGPRPCEGPFARSYRVLDTLVVNRKRLREACRKLGGSTIIRKTRGIDGGVNSLPDLPDVEGDEPLVVIVWPGRDRWQACLAREAH